MRLIRRRLPSSWRTKPIDAWRARTVSVRSVLPPMTLTQTLAWRRSGDVSTSVIVANPIRGIGKLLGEERADLLAQELVDAVGSLAHLGPATLIAELPFARRSEVRGDAPASHRPGDVSR